MAERIFAPVLARQDIAHQPVRVQAIVIEGECSPEKAFRAFFVAVKQQGCADIGDVFGLDGIAPPRSFSRIFGPAGRLQRVRIQTPPGHMFGQAREQAFENANGARRVAIVQESFGLKEIVRAHGAIISRVRRFVQAGGGSVSGTAWPAVSLARRRTGRGKHLGVGAAVQAHDRRCGIGNTRGQAQARQRLAATHRGLFG
jgi:hypothetical protein